MRQLSIGILLYCSCLVSNYAVAVPVPNYSFEAPPTAFVDTNIVEWQKSPPPFWYDENANGPWAQLTGVFANTPPDSPNNDHIVNCDGNQGAFLFALPGVALFQDQAASTNSTFTATYEAGKSYDLTVGLLGNGGGMSNGVPLQIWLYYRDSSNNMVPIATTTVTNSSTQFPDRNHFIDFTAHLPTVQASDPWAGKNIGIEIISTVDFSLAGGYWDIDNVRLTTSLAVPNYSFEAPETAFADTNIVEWQKSPTPFWYDENANGPWAQLTGVFANSPPDSPNNDHIVNCDGNQGAFLFALPGVALFQDQAASTNSTFTVTYEAGTSYDLTVGVIGNGGGMSNGVPLQIWLYYRDASSNMVPIATTTVTNSATQFPDRNHFVDFTAHLPTVQASDPWAGKNIGIEIISTVDFGLAGGYWDLDNVRLSYSSQTAPTLTKATASNGQITFTLLSDPGAHLEVLTSTDITQPSANWTTISTVTNDTGTMSLTNSIDAAPARFYQVRQIP